MRCPSESDPRGFTAVRRSSWSPTVEREDLNVDTVTGSEPAGSLAVGVVMRAHPRTGVGGAVAPPVVDLRAAGRDRIRAAWRPRPATHVAGRRTAQVRRVAECYRPDVSTAAAASGLSRRADASGSLNNPAALSRQILRRSLSLIGARSIQRAASVAMSYG
jgi:hypothetical protein